MASDGETIQTDPGLKDGSSAPGTVTATTGTATATGESQEQERQDQCETSSWTDTFRGLFG